MLIPPELPRAMSGDLPHDVLVDPVREQNARSVPMPKLNAENATGRPTIGALVELFQMCATISWSVEGVIAKRWNSDTAFA